MVWLGTGISILSQLTFWAAFFIAFVRICCAAGLSRAQSEPMGGITPPLQTSTHTPYLSIILFALGVRLAMLALGYIILWQDSGAPTMEALFRAFQRGDSHHYLTLATIGYSWTENGRNLLLVFFPLYGWLVWLVNLGIDQVQVSAYLVSFASFAAALCYLYRLVRLDASERVAWWAVILISIAPHSFFFGVPMTESLFLLTTVMTLYYIRTHNWPLAGIAGAFAILTRMVGLVLIVVAAVEFLIHYRVFGLMKEGKWGEFFRLILSQGLWILLMLVGGLTYLGLNWYIAGDPFQFLYYQRTHWSNEFAYFGSLIVAQFENIIHMPHLARTIFIPNILAFLLTIGMLLYATIRRLNLVLIAYLIGYTFICFAVSWLLSGGRYMAAAAPLFIFLAHFTEQNRISRVLVPGLLIASLVATLRWYLLGGPVF
ncbi:MAG: glycosyltransferase family 39 protein [Oscillospiraceae bacterium]|nr:glycosyltransferase family 39 protein [Oscillospiraceae bacterium]